MLNDDMHDRINDVVREHLDMFSMVVLLNTKGWAGVVAALPRRVRKELLVLIDELEAEVLAAVVCLQRWWSSRRQLLCDNHGGVETEATLPSNGAEHFFVGEASELEAQYECDWSAELATAKALDFEDVYADEASHFEDVYASEWRSGKGKGASHPCGRGRGVVSSTLQRDGATKAICAVIEGEGCFNKVDGETSAAAPHAAARGVLFEDEGYLNKAYDETSAAAPHVAARGTFFDDEGCFDKVDGEASAAAAHVAARGTLFEDEGRFNKVDGETSAAAPHAAARGSLFEDEGCFNQVDGDTSAAAPHAAVRGVLFEDEGCFNKVDGEASAAEPHVAARGALLEDDDDDEGFRNNNLQRGVAFTGGTPADADFQNGSSSKGGAALSWADLSPSPPCTPRAAPREAMEWSPAKTKRQRKRERQRLRRKLEFECA